MYSGLSPMYLSPMDLRKSYCSNPIAIARSAYSTLLYAVAKYPPPKVLANVILPSRIYRTLYSFIPVHLLIISVHRSSAVRAVFALAESRCVAARADEHRKTEIVVLHSPVIADRGIIGVLDQLENVVNATAPPPAVTNLLGERLLMDDSHIRSPPLRHRP